MDIVFAIDTSSTPSQLSEIESFLTDLIDNNFYTSQAHVGFVLFNNNETHITTRSISVWNNNFNTYLKNYLQNTITSHSEYTDHNKNIGLAIDKSIRLFRSSSLYYPGITQRTLILITHNNPLSDICGFKSILESEYISINIIKINDNSQSGYTCMISSDDSNWFEVDRWSNNGDASAFYSQYIFLKEVFCIDQYIITPSPTVDPISVPLIVPQVNNQPATYQWTIRNQNIFLHTINTESAIRNKITLAIQDYFQSSGTLAYTFIVEILDINYDYQTGDSEIEFTVNKPPSSGWSDEEINNVYVSEEDAQFYFLLTKHLELQWDNNGNVIDEFDIKMVFESGSAGEIEVKRDYTQIRITDFPFVSTPSPVETTTTTQGM